MSETAVLIDGAVPGAVLGEIEHRGELTIEISAAHLREAATFVKGAPLSYVLLSDVTCADFPEEPGRFRVAYHLFSIETADRLRLRAWAGADEPELPSVTSVWSTANWHEREVFDMFGVRFTDHPDMSRILMPVDWDGHPLRRDYPLGGEEVIFTDEV